MSIQDFAKDELTRAGMFDPDSDYDGAIGHAVMKMIDLFAKENHSGASAAMAVSLFSMLARFEPLTPLTGDDSEWTEVGERDGKPVFQNKRCSRVFKTGDRAYDIEAVIFREPSGACFTSRDSRRDVAFPYTPSREYVDVPGST